MHRVWINTGPRKSLNYKAYGASAGRSDRHLLTESAAKIYFFPQAGQII
jgi:hypothetical protein